MFTVMEELAQRVADRSPPSKLTSTASAWAMFRTLSVSALISSREYIMVASVYQRGRGYEEPHAVSAQRPASGCRVRVPRARHAETVRGAGPSVPRAGLCAHADRRGGGDRDNWWHSHRPRSLHTARGVRAVGGDGGRLFHAALPEGCVADHQRRRARRP